MIPDIAIDAFDYELPDERIARFPLDQRDRSKLLIYNRGEISESIFDQIPKFIPSGSMLVFNNSRVIEARMLFHKTSGAPIEIFCLEPNEPANYEQAFLENRTCVWLCLVGNSKRWKEGRLYGTTDGVRCSAERVGRCSEAQLVKFEWDRPDWNFADLLEKMGELPIPPYLNRRAVEADRENYQTVYSKVKGSVAAPTAGLHFTKDVLAGFKDRGVDLEELTLHVGAATFKPVKSNSLAGHSMHSEWFSVKKSTIENLLGKLGRVYAVGTTTVRTLESLYFMGCVLEEDPAAGPEKLTVGQWMPYDTKGARPPVDRSLQNVLEYLTRNDLELLTARTEILIAPGYDFRMVDGVITNFHQPKSTLLLLVSAFANGDWRRVYDYALSHNFRFLSYGDSSLLVR